MDMEALTARAEEAAYQAVRAFRAFRKPSNKQEAAAAPQLHSPGYPATSAPGDVQAPPAPLVGPSVAPWD
jgi:hypothetical protein